MAADSEGVDDKAFVSQAEMFSPSSRGDGSCVVVTEGARYRKVGDQLAGKM